MPSHYKFKRKVLAQAVTAACLSMAANALAGTGSCSNSGINTISSSEATACGLLTGDSVAVNTAPGEITVNVGSGAITIVGTATAPIVAGTITNSGIISNTVAAGIYLQGGAQSGAILNNTGSTISGQTYGIEATSGNIIAGITNDGTIAGNTDGMYFGGGGGTTTGITNSAGATVSGGNNGIYVTGTSSGQAGGVTNAGTIAGAAGDGIAISSSSMGALTNDTGGTISGKNAVFLSSGATVDSISNSSQLTGTANDGIGIWSSSHITGAITNATGGIILGSENGIGLSSQATVGSIANSGTITGTSGAGINVGSKSGISSGITNDGMIFGGNGIAVYTGGSIGGIANSGIVNSAGGVISGKENGILLTASTLAIPATSTTPAIPAVISTVDNISNSGEISGTNNDGIRIESNSKVTNAITNNIGGIIFGKNAVFLGSDATVANINNSSTLIGMANDGIGIWSGSKITGAITNTAGGLILGNENGIGLSSQATVGSITNNGRITGTNGDGINVGSKSGISSGITNGGKISGNNGIAVYTGGTIGSIANSGIVNSAGGVISGKENGILLTASIPATETTLAVISTVASISNSGEISGTNNDGIRIESNSKVTNAITNNTGGIILGNENGIGLLSTATVGSITNNGTISAVVGIAVHTGSNVSSITNNAGGVIRGTGGVAIDLEGANTSFTTTAPPTTITNSGLLDGRVVLENSTLNLEGTTGSITGAVSGTTGSIVNVNGTFSTANTFSVGTLNISSGGWLNLAHGMTASVVTINAGGTIQNTGSTSAINLSGAGVPIVINNGGALQGNLLLSNSTLNFIGTTGTVTGAVTETPGSIIYVATGNLGTIGSYAQDSDSVFKVGAFSSTSGDYGKLVVNSTATLPVNAKIDVNVSSGHTLVVGDTLAGVLTAATLNATTFTIHDNSFKLDWQFTGAVVGNAVDLTATSTGMTTLANAAVSAGQTRIAGLAGVLDGILGSALAGTPVGSGMTLALDQLTNLSSAAQVGEALQQFSPVLQGGAAQSTVDIVRNGPTHVVHEMMQDTVGLSSGDTVRSDSRGWIKPFGSRAEQDDRNGASGYTANSYGLVLGKDNKISEQWKVGAAVSYSTSRVGSTNGLQNIGIRTRQIDLYAADYLDELTTLHLQFVIGSNRSVSRRAVYGYVASSNYNSTHTLMNAELERRYQMNGKITLIPMVGVEYAHIKVNGYAETGASSLNLVVNSQSQNALVLSTGSKMAYKLSDESRLVGNLNVGYDTQAKQAAITSSFSSFGGSTFVTNGIKPSPVVVRAGVSYEVEKANGTEIVTRYGVDTKSGYTNQMLSINWRMLF